MKKINSIIVLIILSINFFIRLIDQSKIIFRFPLDITNDISAYMSHLFFLKECGFLEWCPYWYNGFITFTTIPPGWFFFTYPIYWITNNILLATWISWILLFILGFIVIWVMGKVLYFKRLDRVLFFFLFYGNAIMIGNFIRLMRVHELMGLVLLTWVLIILVHSWERDHISNWFLHSLVWVIPLIIITHPVTTLLLGIILISLFISINNRIRLIVISFIGVSISLFWLIPYLKNFIQTIGMNIHTTESLLVFSRDYLPQQVAVMVVGIGFIILCIFYLIEAFEYRVLFSVSPFLIMAFLLVTHLTPFIPILNSIYVDSQLHILIFLSIFIFIKLSGYWNWNSLIRKYGGVVLVILVVISVVVSNMYTPKFRDYTSTEEDILGIFPYVNGTYITAMENLPETSYVRAYYSYGPIYYNLSTSHGWSLPNKEYQDLLLEQYDAYNKKNCSRYEKALLRLNTTDIIGYGAGCDFLESCGLNKVRINGKACLYKKSEKEYVEKFEKKTIGM